MGAWCEKIVQSKFSHWKVDLSNVGKMCVSPKMNCFLKYQRILTFESQHWPIVSCVVVSTGSDEAF